MQPKPMCVVAMAVLVIPACAARMSRGPAQHAGVRTAPVAADEVPFAALSDSLRTGDRVRISAGGQQTTGRVTRLSPSGIALRLGDQEVTFVCEDVQRLQKLGDPVTSGALIGGLLAMVPAWNACNNEKRDLPCVALGVGTFAAIGALLDRAHDASRLVYVASPTGCGTRIAR